MQTKTKAKLIVRNIFQTDKLDKQKEVFNQQYEKYINCVEKRFVTSA